MSAASERRSDATERVISAWRRERPDLEVAPMETWSRITLLAKYLDQARREVLSGHGLQSWEFDVLADLRRAGAPYELRPGQMTAQMMVTSGTMTNRIDRLEASGLVERRSDAADGRVTQVRLTDAGRDAVDGALADLLQREAQLMAPLAQSQGGDLAAMLGTLLARFEAEGSAGPGGRAS
ncbi:MAG: MarR family transcriptional regulator [Micrococcales bacterium]|nr:MarR family transcriptional regulator [Micrococcales bacterium]